jgi:hypothetical protein
MGCMTPFSVARCKMRCRGSIARMKSMGEIGSPCRSPLSCFRGFPRIPFRRTLDEAVDKARLIQSLHFALKSSLCRTSRRQALTFFSKKPSLSQPWLPHSPTCTSRTQSIKDDIRKLVTDQLLPPPSRPLMAASGQGWGYSYLEHEWNHGVQGLFPAGILAPLLRFLPLPPPSFQNWASSYKSQPWGLTHSFPLFCPL